MYYAFALYFAPFQKNEPALFHLLAARWELFSAPILFPELNSVLQRADEWSPLREDDNVCLELVLQWQAVALENWISPLRRSRRRPLFVAARIP
ncbi:hypothetical protein MTO96_005764 [Rhipicephalus appendiculatus]